MLKMHANDQALHDKRYSTPSWPIEATADGASYRYFRIFQTGKNSSSYDDLFCADIELYGYYIDESSAEATAQKQAAEAAMNFDCPTAEIAAAEKKRGKRQKLLLNKEVVVLRALL